MSAIAARPIRSIPGTWLIETNRYVAFISKEQVSSLFPKASPYVTSGYWDDIALAGCVSNKQGKLAVLGAGIGSFLPLLSELAPAKRVTCVEINSEIASTGKKLALGVLGKEHSERIEWVRNAVESAGTEIFAGSSAVFVDIYRPDGIHELSIDEGLHASIRHAAGEETLVFANVYDQLFGGNNISPTEEFISVLSRIYRSIIVLRRSASSTLVCSWHLDEKSLEKKLRAAINSHSRIWPESAVEVIGSTKIRMRHSLGNSVFDRGMLRFEAQKSAAGAQAKIGTGLIEEALKEIANIGPLALIKLSRKPSAILGE